MHTTSLFDAKTHLSRIVEELVSGREDKVIISRHGKAMVQVTALQKLDATSRIGLARGRFTVPDDIDGSNPAIAAMFGAGGTPQ
jgi:antitoxin (DNA-binding transcriptional repressor) of toxin-antitoxin stability system